ncbi:hypothetical protein JG688_00016404 [Phytophthora aleatoria]|uniref:Crinkler effector protein N-terminal domain-containing protein n=1 Tax=Phytophthora aleatoria TaxID=2496075 RepID=A0A8J5MCV8_9STRA|nr:hypothetical protein JG688_00016404 [Phytophthora aleatoria]
MVRLVCVLTLPPTSPFWVELDESRTLDELKKETKRVNEDLITCDADKLQLYLAKRGGNWLNN